MNSANRLAKLLDKISSSTERAAFKVFEDVFEVKGCVAVSNKLRLCETQILILEEKAHKGLIDFLRNIFGCTQMLRDISSLKASIPGMLITLETAGAFMPNEIINQNNLTDLAETLEKMRQEVEKSDFPQHYKDVINEFMHEMNEGIIDIDLGGIDAFKPHAERANGKIVLYHEAFSDKTISELTKKTYDLSTKILSEGQTWAGVLGFVGKFLN